MSREASTSPGLTPLTRFLLDVNALLAAVWGHHSRHSEAFAWLKGKPIVLCPLAELGFLRISSNKKAINVGMEKAREALEKFCAERKAERITDDLPALESYPKTSEQVTDFYLADLAARHGMKLATFDEGLTHPAVQSIPSALKGPSS
ncbi:MAG: PIN domain-containing protein [Acidobacteria bacterium]|nr:PIN domain-containing protein [Acidobacteriota bacterium]